MEGGRDRVTRTRGWRGGGGERDRVTRTKHTNASGVIDGVHRPGPVVVIQRTAAVHCFVWEALLNGELQHRACKSIMIVVEQFSFGDD